ELLAAIDKNGEVRVEGSHVGRLEGFRFIPDTSDGASVRTLLTAANRVLRGEVATRARKLAGDGDDGFSLDLTGRLSWRGAAVGKLIAGETVLTPRVDVQAGDFLEGEARERVRQRLQAFARDEIARRLAPLLAARDLPLDGGGRGLVFQLIDALGCVPAEAVGGPVPGLEGASRRALGRLGIRFGTESIYVAPFLQVEAMRFRALLWAVRQGRPVPETPTGRRGKAIAIDPDLPESYYAAIGRRV